MIKKRVVLTFPKEAIEQPVTYRLIKEFDLMINILSAKVEPNEEGRLVVEISGEKKQIERGMDYLKGLGVEIQSLASEVKWDSERCTHCTACIPLCPSHALSVERKEMRVSFNPEGCILCGLCLKACPYQAIEVLF